METITDSFNNITVSELYSKLAQKQAQLQKLGDEELKEQAQIKSDYYDSLSVPKNYDETDYKRVLEKFKDKDSQIKAHEQSHAASADTVGGINYIYQQGPDGKMYAVGGSVRLDVSMPDDPKAAQAKLDKIKDAALSPNDPSGADLAIANQAQLNKMLIELKSEENIDGNNQ